MKKEKKEDKLKSAVAIMHDRISSKLEVRTCLVAASSGSGV